MLSLILKLKEQKLSLSDTTRLIEMLLPNHSMKVFCFSTPKKRFFIHPEGRLLSELSYTV